MYGVFIMFCYGTELDHIKILQIVGTDDASFFNTYSNFNFTRCVSMR